ncbi:MAG: hypothetical protein ACE5MI_11195 [Acidimicrobiia bacterium]
MKRLEVAKSANPGWWLGKLAAARDNEGAGIGRSHYNRSAAWASGSFGS